MLPEIIGLIPAAGHATRLSPLPCSKEMLPIGFARRENGEQRVMAVCEHLLRKMTAARVQNVFMVLRQGKWDIPNFLSNIELGVNIGYIVTPPTLSVPHTIDQAYPFIKNNVVTFGFPDIVFESANAFELLVSYLTAHHCDVVLGLFPAPAPEKVDTVALAGDKVVGLEVKSPNSVLKQSWGVAVWTPAFSEFLHRYLKKNSDGSRLEIHLSNVFLAAIEEGLDVRATTVSATPFLDIGTPEGYRTALNAGRIA